LASRARSLLLGAVLVGTNVDRDDRMQKVTAALRPGVREMTKGRKAGDVLARVDVDEGRRAARAADAELTT